MARIKKRVLRWTASESPQTAGYKLYWAQDDKVSYDSQHVTLGNVTEVVLPDDVEDFRPKAGPVEFGIAAVDELGNESDLITISAPYQFSAPQAPEELWMESPEDPAPSDDDTEEEAAAEPITLLESDFKRLDKPSEPVNPRDKAAAEKEGRPVSYFGRQEAQ